MTAKATGYSAIPIKDIAYEGKMNTELTDNTT